MSEFIGSETVRPAPRGIISRRETDMANNTTVWQGSCSVCGDYLPPEKWARCKGGDLICTGCRRMHEGASYCYDHFASEIISKPECKVLYCFNLNTNPKRITLMSPKQIEKAFKDLEAREYLAIDKGWFSETKRITDKGYSALSSGYSSYSKDADFQHMLGEIR